MIHNVWKTLSMWGGGPLEAKRMMLDVLKAASMWGSGALLGLLLRLTLPFILPGLPSIFIVRQGATYVLPPNRLAFWFCLFIGFIAGLIPLARVIMQDLIPR
jgi:hypothetical protein